MGLAISRDLARGMDGDLTVSNQPGGGACFTLTLRRVAVSDGAVGMAFTGEMPVGLARLRSGQGAAAGDLNE